MEFKDSDFISKEKHELDYVLRKWNKRCTNDNRALLSAALDRFNADPSLEPHTRPLFYQYAEKTGLVRTLEGKEGEAPSESAAAPSPAPGAAPTRQSAAPAEPEARKKFPWWWILVALLLLLLVFFLLRSCGGCSPAAPGAAQNAGQSATPAAAEAPTPTMSAAPSPAPAETAAQPAAEAAVAGQASATAAAPKLLGPGSLPAEALVLRFVANSPTELAPGEAPKLTALIAALKGFDQGSLLLVGHAADVGYPAGELAISQGRARFIAERLAAAGLPAGIKVAQEGRGAAAMLGGSDPEAAKAASRRVEVSLR